jgi:hypothetical protein
MVLNASASTAGIVCGCALLATALTGCEDNPGIGFNGTVNAASAFGVTSTAFFSSVRVLPFSNLGSSIITGVNATQVTATGVVTISPYTCATGSGTQAWDDVDEDGVYSTDDTFTFTFNKCAVQNLSQLLTYTGQMTMTQFTLTGDPLGNPLGGWQMGAVFTLTDLTVTDGKTTRVYNGGFDFSSASPQGVTETIAISGQSLAGVADNATDTLKDFSVTEDNDRASFVYSNLQISATLDSAAYGALTIETTAPFSGAASFTPSSGAMLIAAADKSSVRMSVESPVNITLEVDANGDGIVDSTHSTVWSVLQSS